MKRTFTRRSFEILTALVASCITIETGVSGEPNEMEQYYLERVNQARANPQAEVQRQSGQEWAGAVDLNEGLPAGTISADPKPPFAINEQLGDAASEYAEFLLNSGKFGHTVGSTPGERVTAKGYLSPFVGENLSVNTGAEVNVAALESLFAFLFVDKDANIPNLVRIHRQNFMDDYVETGFAVRWHENFEPFGQAAVLTVQVFGRAGDAQITGVAYKDNDGNQFYTPNAGEALGGLTVEAINAQSGSVAASTLTYQTGGYSLPVSENTTYNVRFSGEGIDETYQGISVATENVKVDAIDPGFDPPTNNAAFKITEAVYQNGALSITWTSEPDAQYQVEKSAGFQIWEISGGIVTATGATATSVQTKAAGSAEEYFRVRKISP